MGVADLFVDEPVRWGLRGDPYLWRELGVWFGGVPLPGTVEEMRGVIEGGYEALTGRRLGDGPPFLVERFQHGGMSGGLVSPRFWVETAVPLLLGRWEAATQ